jgi:hypothetical protein
MGNGTNPVTITAATNNPVINITGTTTVASNAAFVASSSAINLQGNLKLNSSSTFIKGTGVVRFNGAGAAQTITDSNTTKQDLGNVVIGNDLVLGSNVKMASTTVTSGKTLNLGSSTLSLTGNDSPLTIEGTVNFATSMVEFIPANTTGVTVPALGYNNLKLNKAGNTFTPGSGAWNINNNFELTAGTFIAPAILTVNGNFTNTGSYSHNSGNVVFASSTKESVITGATTFNNITSTEAGKTIKFAAGTVFTFDGTMTLTGSDTKKISMRSDTPNSQWLAHFNIPQASITNTNIRDSGCDGGCADITLSDKNSNGGNNGVCWKFPAPPGGSAGHRWGKTTPIEGGSGYSGNANSGGSKKGDDDPIEGGTQAGGQTATGGDNGGSITAAP